jgi:hypothetical protein
MVGLVVGGAGCASHNGIVEVDSGDPIADLGKRWSAAKPVYAVHVGERVRFRFRARHSICDYATMSDASRGQVFDCGPPIDGRFEWDYTVAQDASPGSDIELAISGYVLAGARDSMPVRGALVEAGRRSDPTDLLIASSSVVLRPYQSKVELTVRLDAGTPDWGLTRLFLKRSADKVVRLTRQTPSEDGFRVARSADPGGWSVRYEPKAHEVNRAGETAVELIVADEHGRTTTFREILETP